MKDIFLLTEVYEHNKPGQASHPYIVRNGFNAAARRLIKKGLVTQHPTEGIVVLGVLTDKGEFLLKMMQGMVDAS
jgi:hypothetical protein